MGSGKRVPVVVPEGRGRRLLVIGNEIEVKLHCSQTAGLAFVFESVTPPGEGVPPHVHQHEDEILKILEGEFEIFLDGKTCKASAGAVINFPRSVVHAFKNCGERSGRALFMVTPGENFERFFEELSALPPNAPPDLAKVAEIFGKYGLPIVDGAPTAGAR